MNIKILLPQVLLFVMLFAGCTGDDAGHSGENITEETSVTKTELPAVESEELLDAVSDIPRLSSFIFYQQGEIIHELYPGTLSRSTPVNIKSASKNILSTLTGIAIEQGYIESIDQPVSAFLPGYLQDADESKRDITIRHLLTMSSGLRSTSFGNYGRWVSGRDWTAGALGGEQLHPPGMRMRYSTGDTHILSAVLNEATGMSTRVFAQRYLFGPMGVRIGGWDRSPEGYYFGGNNMALSPGGLLQYGLLYLNEGQAAGEQLVSPEWIAESLEPAFERTSFNPRGHDYGYLWWSNSFGEHTAYFAWGYGGQYLFIVPDLEMVAVLTGNPDARERGVNNIIYRLMDNYVVPYAWHRYREGL